MDDTININGVMYRKVEAEPEPAFKVGDRVEYVKAGNNIIDLVIGSVGTVAKQEGQYHYVEFCDDSWWCLPFQLRRIDTPAASIYWN